MLLIWVDFGRGDNRITFPFITQHISQLITIFVCIISTSNVILFVYWYKELCFILKDPLSLYNFNKYFITYCMSCFCNILKHVWRTTIIFTLCFTGINIMIYVCYLPKLSKYKNNNTHSTKTHSSLCFNGVLHITKVFVFLRKLIVN